MVPPASLISGSAGEDDLIDEVSMVAATSPSTGAPANDDDWADKVSTVAGLSPPTGAPAEDCDWFDGVVSTASLMSSARASADDDGRIGETRSSSTSIALEPAVSTGAGKGEEASPLLVEGDTGGETDDDVEDDDVASADASDDVVIP